MTISARQRVLAAALAVSFLLPAGIFAAPGDPQYVSFKPREAALSLVREGVAVPLQVDAADHPGVLRAARDLQADIERVSDHHRLAVTRRKCLNVRRSR